jgi:uncharacterized protein (DUF58 family)
MNVVTTVGRQPFQVGDGLRGKLDAALADAEALVIDLAGAGDNVEVAAGNRGVVDRAVLVDPLFEAAATAAAAEPFPFLLGECF